MEFVEFSPDFLSSEAWLAMSPAGKIPVLVDGDLTMFESGAMVDYILETYGKGRLLPGGSRKELAEYRQWCWFAEATLIRPLGIYRVLGSRDGRAEALVAEAEVKFHRSMAALEGALRDGRAYLLGEAFTGADVMMGYSVALVERLMEDGYPASLEYLRRISTRPAYQKAVLLAPQ